MRLQAWFAGHDHNLEHLYVDSHGYHVIVSGAGSRCNREFIGEELSRYQWPYSGESFKGKCLVCGKKGELSPAWRRVVLNCCRCLVLTYLLAL